MSFLRILILILLSTPLFAQNAELANSFFRKGEYEKAILLYEPLLENNPIRQDYFKSLLTCYQQLEKYEDLCREIGHPPGEVALAWLLHNPVVTAPIIGPRTIEQLESAVRAASIELDEVTLQRLDEIFPGPGGEAPMAYAW